jgi:glycosyltransferase involved in cell wall biosynthesis
MTSSKHTIVINGLSALQGGGQTYLINLFRFLPDRFRDSLRIIAIVPAGADAFRGFDRIDYITSPFASTSVVNRLIWEKTKLPSLLRTVKADVLYCPGGFVSAFGPDWKSAVAFRNMLPFIDEERQRFPHGYTRARLALLKHIQSQSLRRADLVVFISDFARSIIDLVVGIRSGRSVVIPHGLSDQFRTAGTPTTLNLPSRYVAYVSILDAYKAQIEVVKAWAVLRQRRQLNEKLLLVGPARGAYAEKVRVLIAELGLNDEVLLLGNVPYDHLPSVYHGAVANVFASSCENCPNILLEALAAGKPVLSSDYQPMPEFAGKAVLYFNPYDPETLAKQLSLLLENPELSGELGRRALERSAEFQWKQAADSTWQALSDLAAGSKAA